MCTPTSAYWQFSRTCTQMLGEFARKPAKQLSTSLSFSAICSVLCTLTALLLALTIHKYICIYMLGVITSYNDLLWFVKGLSVKILTVILVFYKNVGKDKVRETQHTGWTKSRRFVKKDRKILLISMGMRSFDSPR